MSVSYILSPWYVVGCEGGKERRKEGERDRLKGGRRGGRGRGQAKKKGGRFKVMGVSWSKTAWCPRLFSCPWIIGD